ncbi:MAG: hypothetical protein PHE17_01740 [Thiothrix sp.]|uniref:hypothetical protein n=1 Tax=Thiothrix sp. TaxID=1032 RepID=UPI002621018F|nr:hypothetical protein [Thiothrix sp.]MDD5391720.1 hypothetical protein [Thiothrix sp.]
MNMEQSLGLGKKHHDPAAERRRLQLYINLKLSSTGQPPANAGDNEFLSIAHDLLQSYREKNRLLTGYLCPADQRIQSFLDSYLEDCGAEGKVRLPGNSVVLDRYGVARELSLPSDSDEFKSDIISSYRVKQGILHNPANDRRTTKGSFHIAEGGLPVPGDKKAVPKLAFARMLAHAMNPPDTLLQLPFTANEAQQAKLFVSLLLRPVVCPEIPGVEAEKSMEIRFFAPGNLVSNLDFVESIFGNAGNPYLPAQDAALDVDHWTGHTGCVILAPHLTRLTKKELGLPHYDQATERQRKDGMCWQEAGELYNDGSSFKVTARDTRGVIVTILADNYYGYCKKEVKTQISYAANLFGLAEEEHAGGALAFQRRNHGEEYGADSRTRKRPEIYNFERMVAEYGARMDVQPEGYAIDKAHPDLIYLPLDIRMDLRTQTIRWKNATGEHCIKLRPGKVYMQPNGYKTEMQKHPSAPSWRIIGTDAEGTFCHKPCTVSGGGKSEISKSLNDAVIYGPVFVQDFEDDMDQVEIIFNHDYTQRLKPEFADEDSDPTRQPLSPERSLGSVIKLLTPSPSNTDEYNSWLASIPPRILSQAFIIKRMYKPGSGSNWRKHFSVDVINGMPGNALKHNGRELVASYLRVGLDKAGNWHTYKVRQDFIATEKVQMEDDISASVVVSGDVLPNRSPKSSNSSVKLVKNCEYRLFQRPDEAIHRGFDKQTEHDMAQPDNFIANFEPLKGDSLTEIVEDVVEFQQYTDPMRNLLQTANESGEYVVSSANPRLVNGKPSQNPRYLQIRPDLQQPLRKYVAEMGARFLRRVPLNQPLMTPVDAVLTGRRNNPPEKGIRPLAVFNPIHYQELPELFMDFICSVTGKSPSTTGAGSEGALTKGPFNALRTTADLNNALVSFIISGYAGFSSAAGYIGANLRVDHDISLLIPEIWARLREHERDPRYLIEHGYLEKLEDFEYQGQPVLASRLGYRITDRFVATFMGKIFDNPAVVFGENTLKPETQGMDVFVDGINNIVEAQQHVAQAYLDDGSIEDACPPLQALLHIMATGSYQGKNAHHPDIRALFTRDVMLNSRWYQQRLLTKQQRDIALWERHCHDLQAFLGKETHQDVAEKMDIAGRLQHAQAKLAHICTPEYLRSLEGTIGADLLGGYA